MFVKLVSPESKVIPYDLILAFILDNGFGLVLVNTSATMAMMLAVNDEYKNIFLMILSPWIIYFKLPMLHLEISKPIAKFLHPSSISVGRHLTKLPC